MHDQGVLAKYFARERYAVKLSQSDVEDIAKQLSHLTNSFFRQPNNFIRYVSDEYDYETFAFLMTIARTDTYDAILIATAEHEKCVYFITDDERLREAVKKLESILLVEPISARVFGHTFDLNTSRRKVTMYPN